MPVLEARRTRALRASEAAWLASLVVGVAATGLIVVLGPPLGRGLFAAGTVGHFVWWDELVRPEPVEQGRYVVALAAPLLLAVATAALTRWAPRLYLDRVQLVMNLAQVVLLSLVVTCLFAQWEVGFGRLDPPAVPRPLHRDYFTASTLLAAAFGTVAIVVGVRSSRARVMFTAWSRDTRARRIAAAAVAVTATVVWLLHALNTADSLERSYAEVSFHAIFTIDETFAVLEGRTPLVDFATQYAALWPYALAAGMSLLGASISTWVALAVTLTGLGMLATYALLRRLAGSAVGGILLFLPVLATSFFAITEPTVDRYTYGNYYGAFPLRYTAPLVLAWLLARHLDGARPRSAWWLFLVTGLILLNGPEIGIPAVAATICALLWTGGRPTWAHTGRMALDVIGGLLAALMLVSVLTLARTGQLPDVGLLFAYSRIFARAGFGMVPMPALGLHVVIYLTFVAVIAVASARALDGSRRRSLTGMLAWIGVFGLGAGAYYAGRSMPAFLTATFAWWSIALALLLVASLRSLMRWRRGVGAVPIGQVTCVFGFCVAACSLAQTPVPWQQVDRIQQARGAAGDPPGQLFIARHTRAGESVAILNLYGHRMAYDLGLHNVSPYTGTLSMPLHDQLEVTIESLRDAGGRKLVLTTAHISKDVHLHLEAAGFRLAEEEPATEMQLWLDRGETRGGAP